MELAGELGASLPFTDSVSGFYDDAEVRYGPHAPHLMAVRSIEDANDMVLHRHRHHDQHQHDRSPT
jgi:hypothetical protein